MTAPYPGSLAERILRRDLLVGLVVKMPSPAVIEAAGHSGFDLVVIDTEHGVSDSGELEHHLRAADSAGIPALVRVGANEPVQILRSLDAGAAGVIVPHVNTEREALEAVHAAHYPPIGTRGLAMSTRAGHHSTKRLAERLERAERETVVIVQIEDVAAVPHSRAIAATPQVSSVWIGPSDLSMSLGHPGQLDHPAVAEAVEHIVAGVREADSAVLCVMAGDESEISHWRDRGAGIILFGATNLFADRFSALLAVAGQSR